MAYQQCPEALRAFISRCVPNLDAAELMLALAGSPDEALTPSELVARARIASLSPAEAQKYLDQFVACGLVERSATRYRYAPADAQARDVVAALDTLYTQRPVTLVRLIYSLRDERIQAFADAFRLKKD